MNADGVGRADANQSRKNQGGDMRMYKVVPLILAVFLQSGCEKPQPVPEPSVRLNPKPAEGYAVTISLVGNINSPIGVVGEASYRIHNAKKCIPTDYTRALGGITPDPYSEQPVKYIETDEGKAFVARVFEDAILNEDYYGLGTCDWGVDVLSARIALGSSIQFAAVPGQVIRSGGTQVAFCQNNSLVNIAPDRSCLSEARFEQLDIDLQRSFYRVEISSRRITPKD